MYSLQLDDVGPRKVVASKGELIIPGVHGLVTVGRRDAAHVAEWIVGRPERRAKGKRFVRLNPGADEPAEMESRHPVVGIGDDIGRPGITVKGDFSPILPYPGDLH